MLVGLCGYARVGKNRVADILVEKFGFRQVAFADALKSDLLALFADLIPSGVDPKAWMAENKELLRPLLVEYGRAKRAFDPFYWVNRVEEKFNIAAGFNTKAKWVLTDVRYENEAHWVLNICHGHLIRLHRMGYQAANSEEMQSISQIMNGRPELTVVENIEGNPSHAAKKIAEIVGVPSLIQAEIDEGRALDKRHSKERMSK